MNIYLRRLVLILAAVGVMALFSACAAAPDIELPPLPTYSDETPVPSFSPSPSPSPSPTPSPKPSAAPIVYNTPEPEIADAGPVPTVATDVPIISISGETLPKDMIQCNVATLHGIISVDKGTITKVNAMLTYRDGELVQDCWYTPMQAHFSLAGTVNAELHFATLLPGDYTYVLSAQADNGGIIAEKELIRHNFSVFATQEDLNLNSSSGDAVYAANISQDTDNAALIWNFLIVYLDNPYGAAGVLGNIDVESQCNPQRVQGDLSVDFAFSEMYTQQVDSGDVNRDSFIAAIAGEGYGSGYGLCQWSFDRKEGLYDLAKERGCSVGDLDTQCIYLIMELETKYPELLKLLKSTDNAREAAREFFYVFEQGAEMGDRAGLAEDYLNRFAK